MKNGPFPNRSAWLKYIVPALVLAYLAVNALGIGGYDVIFPLNNTLPALLGAVTALATLWVQRRIVDRPNRRLWLGMAIGFFFWWAAEAIWAILAWLRWAVPYPFMADFFWLAGYLPMYAVLRERLRTLPGVAFGRRVWPFILSSVFVVWALVAVILPTVRSASASQASYVESAINVLYVLADLVLLLYALRHLFAFQKGIYGRAWFWVSLGLALRSVADLVYAYAFTANIYYPGELNWISTLGADVPYNLSYVLILVGALVAKQVTVSFRPSAEVRASLSPIPNTHLLVFVAGDDTVMGVSRNYPGVYPGRDPVGKGVSEALGLSHEDGTLILQNIKQDGLMRERAFLSETSEGRREIRVSGIRIQSPQGEYAGATLLVRTFSEDFSLDRLLTHEQKGTVRYLLGKTGVREVEDQEARAFLLEWCRMHLAAFYDRVYQEGGGILAEAFLLEVQKAAEAHGWPVEVQPNGLTVGELSPTEIRRMCALILETGKRFLTDLIGAASVDVLEDQILSQISPQALQTAVHLFGQER